LLLAGLMSVGGLVIIASLTWGVINSLDQGGESVGLMAIDASEPMAQDIDPNLAPSRLAPAGSSASEAVAVSLASPVMPAVSAADAMLAEQTAPTFDGRPLRKVKTMRMLTTAYSPDARSCGIHADGITASGFSVWTNGMKLVAADTRLLPFGSIVTIPGYNGGKPVPVLDRGGRIKGNRLDLLYPTHEMALQWGAQRLDVEVWEYADEIN
jgi:3D (Asp-Asp-Asp) domain-containing protein